MESGYGTDVLKADAKVLDGPVPREREVLEDCVTGTVRVTTTVVVESVSTEVAMQEQADDNREGSD